MFFASKPYRDLGVLLESQSGSVTQIEVPFTEGPPSALLSKRNPSAMMVYSLLFAAIGVIVAFFFVSILKVNNGTFNYTLDDPYIHLALSDQIRHGNYGIYPGVHAAPASSILFPFLLTPAAGTGLHPYLPLLINVFCLFLTIEIMRRFVAHLQLSEDNFGLVVEAGSIFLMAVCFNLIGVVFTGLEHSLQLATIAAIVYGLSLFVDSGRLPSWLPAVILVAPLVRYESLPLCIGALLVLAIRGRWRTGAATFALLMLVLGGFSVFLLRLGLEPLPSSILVKSKVAANGVAGGGALKSIAVNFANMLQHPTGMVVMLAGVAATALFLKAFVYPGLVRFTSRRLMALALACLVWGHAFGGKFGWIERYEDYVMLGTALLGIYLLRDVIRDALADRDNRVLAVGAAAVALLCVGARYVRTTLLVPIEANNIYEQQMQMHRFVDDFYRGPVAVNDLGLVAYHNPYFVLDLRGLASEKARKLLTGVSNASDYEALVEGAGVRLLIVYDGWFNGKIPTAWKEVGTMTLSRQRVSVGGSAVSFYATDPATALKVRQELADFQKVLPPRVSLTIWNADEPRPPQGSAQQQPGFVE